MNDKHYYGKVCVKHPQLLGERLKSNYNCIGCHAESASRTKKKKYWSDEEHRKSLINRVVLNKAARRLVDPEYRQTVQNAAVTRRVAKLKRIPSWADMTKIREIYKNAKELGMTVDHIIPLRGQLVSGLHVENNLQLLPSKLNSSKGNKYTVGD